MATNKILIEKILAYFYGIWFLWAACFVINIITLLLIFYKIHPGDRTLALQYNVLVGVEWYGLGKNLYFIPGVGLLLTAANLILYVAMRRAKFFLASLSLFTSICLQVIMLSAVLFLARVN